MTADAVERTFVLGLDGVPWGLLRSWATDGELPHFQKLMETGASGPLESTKPPTTPLAWPSIATGVRPDKHGIYAFRGLTESYTTEMNTSTDIKQPVLWEYLSPSVVANVPMTFPATEIDGKMVTGMMTPSMEEQFTHPSGLVDRIQATVPEYEIGLNWNDYDGTEDEFRTEFSALFAARRKLMQQLMETDDWKLFFFVFTEPDRLQHLVWGHEALLQHYKELDDILGEVMAYVSESDANLFVVSDHGFGPVSQFIHVNTVLEQHGFLTRKQSDGSRGLLESVGITKDRVRKGLQVVNAEQFVHSVLPDSVVDTAAGAIPGDDVLYDVVFSETQAFMSDCGNVYINDTGRFDSGTVAPQARRHVTEDVQSVLEAVADPETGKKLLNVHDGDELFPTDPESPDLVLESVEGYTMDKTLSEEILTGSGVTAGDHRPEGVIHVWGPNIKSGAQITDATVYDVAPTLLQSHLYEIPRNADGRILDVFRTDSPPERTEPSFTDYRSAETDAGNEAEFGDVEERLKGLGYLD